MVNLTTGKIVNYTHSGYYELITDWDVPYEEGEVSNAYQVMLAHGGKDSSDGVATVAEIKDVLVASNVVYQHPQTWETLHECYYEVDYVHFDCTEKTNLAWAEILHGATPNKTLYLVSNSDGTVVANEQDDVMSWLPEPENNKYFPYMSHAVVADPFEGSDPPKHVSDLKNIVDGKSAAPGIQNKEELSGGSNPSVKCTTGCYGDPINAFTGEFFETQSDISIPTVGLPLSGTRTFSTQRKDIKGIMGFGWRNSYEMDLYSSKTNAGVTKLNLNSRILNFEQENGSMVEFTKKDDGTYHARNNVQLTLEKVNTQFVITRKKFDKFTFNSAGKLVKIQDRHENTVTLEYLNSKISKISDTRGNFLNFTYDTTNLLTKIASGQGRSVTYTYTANKLTKVKNEQGIETSYTYDGQKRVKTLTDERGGITENFYNTDHQVIRQEDPMDNKLKFAYDGANEAVNTKITNPDNSTLTDYYFSGMLTKRIKNEGTPNEQEWSYSYDGYGNVASEVYPDKNHTSSIYDTNGYLAEFTNQLGAVLKFKHDEFGNLLESTDDKGRKTVNTYNAQGDLLTVKNALGEITKFVWNTDGTLKKTIDHKGNKIDANPDDYTTTYAYTNKGQIESTTNALSQKSSSAYDTLGRATSATSPLGNKAGNLASDYTVNSEYNALDLPVKTTDELGNATQVTYDTSGNPLTITDAKNNVTTMQYNLLGLPTGVETSDGTSTVTYDNMHRVLTSTSNMGKVNTNTYDIKGNLTQTTDPMGRVTKFEYDLMDRLVKTIDSKNVESKLYYDAAGNVIRAIDGKGNISYSYYDKAGRLVGSLDKEDNYTSFKYDELNRIVQTTLPTKKTETLEYDESGNTVKRTNPMGEVEEWSYDSLNRLVSYTNQENKKVSYEYDENSQPIKETRIDGSVINFEYTRTGQSSKIDYPSTEKDTVFEYDTLGNIIGEKASNAPKITTTYDVMGRMLTRGTPDSKVNYEYNADSQQSKITYPSGRKTIYSYDLNGNLTNALIDGIGTVEYTYDERNQQTSMTLPNGVKESLVYDTLGQLESIDVANATGSLHKVTREYTPNSNIKTSTIGAEQESYTHDSLNRTTGTTSTVNEANGINEYNDANHLIKMMGETVVSDKTGKPSKVGVKDLSYDTRGNRIKETTPTKVNTLGWSVDDSLISWSNAETQIDYEYGSNGLLSSRVENVNDGEGSSENFTWNENTSNALLISDDKFEYVYGSSRVPVAQVNIETSEVQYIHTDFIGSVIAVTNDNATTDSITQHGAYGKRIGSNVTRFGYAGEWVDPVTNYSYNRARWYDASTAHFLSLDPLVQSTQEAYGYTGGNPITRIDPSGLNFLDDAKKAIGDAGNAIDAIDFCWEGSPSFMSSSCLNFTNGDRFQNFSDGAAAFGDNVSYGVTDLARDAMGTNNVVNKCSKAYAIGDAAGELVSSIDPKKQVTKKAIKAIAPPKQLKAIEAPKDSNPVADWFREAGPGGKTMAEAYDTFERELVDDYISQPGVYANGSVPVDMERAKTHPSAYLGPVQKPIFNSIGDKNGCHHCGASKPETPNKVNWVMDHMPANHLNKKSPVDQLYYPQCHDCMSKQGNAVQRIGRRS